MKCNRPCKIFYFFNSKNHFSLLVYKNIFSQNLISNKINEKISVFFLYLYVHGIDAKRIDTCTLAQLCSFAHHLHSYLVYLYRGMKLIVIAYYPNNSHFYFFSLNLFILSYINNRRISD